MWYNEDRRRVILLYIVEVDVVVMVRDREGPTNDKFGDVCTTCNWRPGQERVRG